MERTDQSPLVQLQGLKKYFPIKKGIIFDRVEAWIKALDGIDLSIDRHQIIGLVGESGSGKSTLAKILLLLEKPTDGKVFFEEKDVFGFDEDALKNYRHMVQAVFQNPYSSLSPRLRVKNIISEPLKVDGKLSKAELEEKASNAIKMVGLGQNTMNLFPHELSGGQRQRVAIARAVSTDAKLILLDEPTSALDVSVRLQIVNLLLSLHNQLKLTYLLIGHDLAMVAYMSTYIAVMYLGKIVEFAETKELLQNPYHPYTRALLSAALPNHPKHKKERIMLPGEIANPLHVPPGCRFHPRCCNRKESCSQNEPSIHFLSKNHWVACHV